MKTLKLEKDDKMRPFISLVKEHPTHKGVYSFKINKFNSSKKYKITPSKLTNEQAVLVLTKEAFKRIRTPTQILDYIKPVTPISTATRKRISPDYYKTILGVMLSLAQQTNQFTFSDCLSDMSLFAAGNKLKKAFTFKGVRQDYIPIALTGKGNDKNLLEMSKIPLTEEQKLAIGLASRGHW